MKKGKILLLFIFSLLLFFACKNGDNELLNKSLKEFDDSKNSFYKNGIIEKIKKKLSDNNDNILKLFTISEMKIKSDNNENINSFLNKGVNTIDDEGNIYLVALTGEIYKVSQQGNLIKTFHQIGRGPGEYVGITSICVDDEKNIYILDIWQKLIIKYNSSFEYLVSFRYGNEVVAKLGLNSEGNLIVFATIAESDPLIEINKNSGEIIRTFGQSEFKTKKYGSAFAAIGSIFNYNKKYYYIFPLSYQLFITDNSNKTKIITYNSSYFSDVKKDIFLSRTKTKYDVIEQAIPINEELLLLHIRSYGEKGYSKRGFAKAYDYYEIVSIYGDVIKEKIPYNHLYKIYGQIEHGKLFSIYYKEAENDIVETYLRILNFNLN